MKPRPTTAACLGLLVVVGLTASCRKLSRAGSERYVLVTANINLPYWQEARAGFKDAAQTLGVTVEFTGPTTYSPEEELKAFQDAVSTRPSGILVSPARAQLFKEAIDSAVQAGIPVICVDSDSPQSRRILFIGTDNFRAGAESAHRIASLLGGHGRVVVITILAQFNLSGYLTLVDSSNSTCCGLLDRNVSHAISNGPRTGLDVRSECGALPI